MTNQNKIFIAIAIFAVIGVGYSVSTSNTNPTTAVTNTPDTTEVTVTETNDTVMDEEMTTTGEADMTNDAMMAQGPGEYIAYEPSAVAASNADSIILNFSATWCPSCRALDKDINENLSTIPAGVEIYKVDYDSNVALRQQYGVTTQHTLVEVTADGTMIQKWSGGNTLESVVAKI
jgi:thiol-disulfide isomerase/thioredoxin